MTLRKTLVSAAVAVLMSACAAVRAEGLLQQVSTLQGTDSRMELSHGGTLPLVGAPWPMTHWAPQTTDRGGWFFQSTGKSIQGFRATRQPSPWMGDNGQFLLMPQSGAVVTEKHARASAFDMDASTFKPDHCRIQLKKQDIGAELTASERCAVLRMTFKPADATGRLVVEHFAGGHFEVDGRTIRGWSAKNDGGVAGDFKSYFVITLDHDITASKTYEEKGGDGKMAFVGGYVEFANDGKPVEATVGTSYISYDQAELNIKTEATGGFDAVRARTAEKWESNLARLKVEGGTDEQRRTFYSCLYRSQTFPHRLYEIGADGKETHYSPYDGKVHPGVLYGDIGFWDVYRTDFPFWTVAFPDRVPEIMEGFVQAYREGGWMPQWPAPGHRACMIGTHSDGAFADVIAKGIKGFDWETAYEAAHKNAFEKSAGTALGREGLEEYAKLGYVPGVKDYAVSRSLDYAYDDWAVAQIAKAVGKNDDYELLMKRSQSYKNLWDPSVGFFRAKDESGKWLAFDEFWWGDPYVEGGPWQDTWAVMHDFDGLAELMGGKGKMTEKLDRMMGLPPVFHTGAYGGVIHEMTEMGVQKFGQYDHGNQPGHHVLYLWALMGQPWKTEYWTRRVCEELYNSGPRGFPGDEDNGEMSCWFLFSSMGMYPACPGKPEYVLTSPLFDKVTLQVPGGKAFVVSAKNNGSMNRYAVKRSWNGKAYDGVTIPHSAVVEGGEMAVELADRPK